MFVVYQNRMHMKRHKNESIPPNEVITPNEVISLYCLGALANVMTDHYEVAMSEAIEHFVHNVEDTILSTSVQNDQDEDYFNGVIFPLCEMVKSPESVLFAMYRVCLKIRGLARVARGLAIKLTDDYPTSFKMVGEQLIAKSPISVLASKYNQFLISKIK